MTKDLKVGLVVFLSFVILIGGLMWLKDWSFSRDSRVYVAEFADTIGLLEGDPVFVRGVKVGKVDRIEVTPDHVSVRLSVETDVPVYTDASAKIGMLEILTGKKVDLIPGISGIDLAEGGVIRGSIGADIPVMLSQVNEVSDDLKTLIRSMNKTLEGLNSILTDKEFQQNSRKLVDQLAVTSTNLADMTTKLNDNSDSFGKLIGQLTLLSTTLNQAVTEITPKAGTTLEATTLTMRTLNEAVLKLSNNLETLQNNQSLASKLIYDPAFATKFTATVDTLNHFLNHIRTKPVKLDIDIW
ncbi:MAG: MCE family protein [Bacteroidetes bacterium]|nr:MCE family protein [Bacteroidota bacterium]